MWAAGGGGEVYSGVATSGTATQPLYVASICSQVPVLRQRAQCSGLGDEWEACWWSSSAGPCGFSALTRRGREPASGQGVYLL